jgi:hypothetical protein
LQEVNSHISALAKLFFSFFDRPRDQVHFRGPATAGHTPQVRAAMIIGASSSTHGAMIA